MSNQEDIEDYFTSKLKELKFNGIYHVEEKNTLLYSEIFDGRSIVNQKQIALKTNSNYKSVEWLHTENINMGNQLISVQSKKMKMKKQLYNLMCQQNDLSIDLSLSRVKEKKMREGESLKKPERSNLTEQQKQNIRQIIKRNRQYNKSLELKTVKFYKTIEQQNQNYKTQHSSVMDETKKTRRQQILQNHKKKQIQKEKERSNRQEHIKKMQELLKQKRLYDQMRQQWKIKENEEESRKIQAAQTMKKQKNINFQQIKRHEQKYNETLKQRKQSRVKLNFSPAKSTRQSLGNSFSPFLNTLIEEQRKKKQDMMLKQQQLKGLIEKRRMYSQIVHKKFIPKKKSESVKNELNQDGQNQALGKQNTRVTVLNSKSLNLFQMHQKGISYMRQVNAQLSKNRKLKPLDTNLQEPNKIKYKNYLAEERIKKGTGLKKKSDLNQINRIMKLDTLPDQLKFQKAKNIADKIEKKDYYSKPKVLVDSISAKLEILRQLSSS